MITLLLGITECVQWKPSAQKWILHLFQGGQRPERSAQIGGFRQTTKPTTATTVKQRTKD
jgi:hypothetical protein